MHTLGEEPAEQEEELLSSHAPQAHQPSPRQRSESAASDATQLRDEVVDLLNLARKASSSTNITIASSTSGSSGSLAGGHTNSDIDMTRSTSSASSVRTGESDLQFPMHTAPFASVKARNAPPGTASREELEELARAVSPFPSSTRQIQPVKPKKKFGIFGGGGGNKKSDESASAIKEVPTSRRAPSPLPPAVLYPDRGPSPCPAIAPEMVSPPAQRSPLHHDALMPGDARRPPVAGAHRAPVSAQHRRKRSMSVSDAMPFAVTQSAGSNMNQSRHLALSGASNSRLNANSNVGIGVRNRPAVYDESYFSNLKTPYYSSLGEGHNKRSSRLARLGIVEHAVENGTKGEKGYGEEESLQKAKERLLAQSRTAIGHPSASSPSQKRDAPRAQMSRVVEAQYAIYHADAHKQDLPSASASLSSVGTESTRSNTATPDSHSSRTSSKKRLAQLVSQDPAGALQFSASNALTAGRSTHQTMWTTPAQPSPSSAASRTNRSNSDASIVDPFLPRGGAPAASSRGSPDSAGGMGRPAQLLVPALNPAPSRHSSSKTGKTYSIGPPPASPLPSPPTAASSVAHSTSSRSISPSQNMTLPPAPSPAPTSPLPPLPAAVCPAPPLLSPPPPGRAPPPVPTQSVNAGATQGNKEIDYRFELRPHRTKQQGRTKLSPLHERERGGSPPLESPSLDKAGSLAPTTTGKSFGSRGIVQRPPSALDMTLLPSPAPSPLPSSTASSSTSNGSEGLSTSISSGSMAPTPKAREFNQDQIRRRQETESTLASQYSTEGEYYEGPQGGSYHAGSRTSDTRSGISTSSSSASTTASSAAMDERGYSGSSAGHTTLSSTTSYSSSSVSSYATRPSLSMDGHSVSSCSDDFSFISTHEHGPHLPHSHSQYSQKSQQPYTYVHVNDAVPLKPPRNMSKMTPSPSCESVNNLAGIGLAGASSNVVFPHSRRMHFGWSRHKAMTDLSSHAVGEEEENIHLPEQQQVNNHNSENATSPGSEVDAYAGILGEYEMAGKEQHGQGDDEGYIGSSPEIVSPKLNLSKSRESQDCFRNNDCKPN